MRSANKYVQLYESAPIAESGSLPSLISSRRPRPQRRKEVNEQDPGSGIRGCEPSRGASLDAELTELIELVWICEAAARREDRIDAAIKYGTR